MRNMRKPVDYDRQLSEINARLRQQINNNAALLTARRAAAAGQPAYTPVQQSPDTRSAAQKRMDIVLQSENLRKNLRKIMTSDEVAQVMTQLNNREILTMVGQWPIIEKYARNYTDITPTQLLDIFEDVQKMKGVPEMDSNIVGTKSQRARKVADIERSMSNLRQVMMATMPAIQEVLKSATNIVAYQGLQSDLVYLKRLNEVVAAAPYRLPDDMSTYLINELLSITSNFPTIRQINEVLGAVLTPDMTLRQGVKFRDFIKPIIKLLYLTPRQLDDFRQMLGISDSEFQQIMDIDQTALAAPFSGDVGLQLLGDISEMQAAPSEEEEEAAPAMGDPAAAAPAGQVLQPTGPGVETPEEEAQPAAAESGPLIEEEAGEFKMSEFLDDYNPSMYYAMGAGLAGDFNESFKNGGDFSKKIQKGYLKVDDHYSEVVADINKFVGLYNNLFNRVRLIAGPNVQMGDEIAEIQEDPADASDSLQQKGTKRAAFLTRFLTAAQSKVYSNLNDYGKLEAHALFVSLSTEQLDLIPQDYRMSWVFYKLIETRDEFASVRTSRVFANLRTMWADIQAENPALFGPTGNAQLGQLGAGLGAARPATARQRQRARIGRIAGRNIMIGRGLQVRDESYVSDPDMHDMPGISVKSDPNMWVPFGCYKINKKQFLKMKRLAVKHVETGRAVDGMAAVDLRDKPEIFNLLHNILTTHNMDYQLLSKINNEDRRWLAKLFHKCKLDDIYEITYEDTDAPRFELLKAHIMAGGDNREELREFRALLMKFVKEGRVRERDALDIVQEMMEL